jgi:MSHA biogenesis protein MshM
VWLRHWGLTRDPFAAAHSPYVSLPSHDEALARLVYSIERQQPHVTFLAEEGLGKTTVVKEAIRQVRSPRRRPVFAHTPLDGRQLLGLLADGLGLPFAAGSDRHGVWRRLARSLRAAAIEGTHVFFVIDGWDDTAHSATAQDLVALVESSRQTGPAASLIKVGRGTPEDREQRCDSWALAIGLERLTRSEAASYLEAKLAAAGCRDRIFTPRGLTRLHSWAQGVPRALDQLATFSLMAGALQGLEVVSPEIVDGVSLQSVVGLNPGSHMR